MNIKFTILFISFCYSVFGQERDNNRIQYQNQFINVNSLNVPIDSNELYFPIQSFPEFTYINEYKDSSTILISEFTFPDLDNHSKIDTFRTYSQIVPNQFDTFRLIWYSKFLYAMDEPLLYNKRTTTEAYRFTWLRSFHHPISIRIEKTEESYWLYLKVCSGLGGYSPGIITKSKKKKITQNQWREFQELLTAYDYWNQKTIGNLPSSDGARWILEGSTSQSYLVLDKKSPENSTDYFTICNYLIELSKVNLKKGEKY